MKDKTVLITGSAHRLGAQIARTLHSQGANIIVHYRQSKSAAEHLAAELNQQRKNSADLIQADLTDSDQYQFMIEKSASLFGRLDALVNNASEFFPTEIGTVSTDTWDRLIASNLKAPFFLAQAAAPHLRVHKGCIINIIDIHADRPMKNYPVYCIAKAGLAMLTKSLAKELGPDIRVNAVSPGAVMWPDDMDDNLKQKIIHRTALKRGGNATDISTAVLFILRDAHYMTGQILTIDGGRTLHS